MSVDAKESERLESYSSLSDVTNFRKCLLDSLIYYPPEVSSMKYCCLGVFRKEYFRLVTKKCLLCVSYISILQMFYC